MQHQHQHPIAAITLDRVIGKEDAGAAVQQRHQATRPQNQDQRAHGILVVEMMSIFEANVDILVGAENQYGAYTDADLMNGAVKNSSCNQSALFVISE